MTDAYRNPPGGEPLIVFGSGQGDGAVCVYAVELETGKTIWQTEVPTTYGSGSSRMAIGSGLVVLATGEGTVYCIDHASGQALWSQPVWRRDQNNKFEPLLLVERRRIIVGHQGKVTCFDPAGSRLWEEPLGTLGLGVAGRVVERH